jgi:enamine deaminase RidA (YjgF/YER057c/UK114 family)
LTVRLASASAASLALFSIQMIAMRVLSPSSIRPIVVAGLARPEFVVEIEAIAAAPERE